MTDPVDSLGATLQHAGIDLATLAIEGGTIVARTEASDLTLAGLPRFVTFGPDDLEAAGELRIEREVARGGLGVVMQATQMSLGRRVAVKQVRPDIDDAWAGGRLLREGYAAGSVEHPNVVPVHALGLDERGRPLLVMKLIEGTPWSERVRALFAPGEPVSSDAVEEHLRIFMAVCNAIAFSHSQGVIHRDIKPANVMIGSFGEVYVVDWGVAAATRPLPGIPLASATDGLEGTPSYMAPEMAQCRAGLLSERTDIYLLGATLYELVTGKKIHGSKTIEGALTKAHAGQPPRLHASVPPELAAIVMQATATDPRARFDNVEQLRDAVASYLRHRSSHALAAAAYERLVELRSVLAEPPSVTSEDISALSGEIRFGFRLALHEWPENAQARQGMGAFLVAMIEYELERDNIGVAVALLAELPEPPADLRVRVHAAREQARLRSRERSELVRVVAERDFDKFYDVRVKMTVLYGAVLGTAIGGLAIARLTGLHEAGYLDAIVVVGLFWATHFLAQRLFVRTELNDINRRWQTMTMAVPPLLLAHFGICAWADIELTAALSLAMVVSAGVMGGAVMLVDLASIVLPIGLLLTAAAVYAWPPYRGISMAVGVVVSFAVTNRVWKRRLDDRSGGKAL